MTPLKVKTTSVCSMQHCRLISASIDTPTSSARLASTGYSCYGVLGGHWTQIQRLQLFTHLYRHASTTAMLYWPVPQKWRLTSCNACWMLCGTAQHYYVYLLLSCLVARHVSTETEYNLQIVWLLYRLSVGGSGVVVSALASINEVNLRQARPDVD